MSNIVDTINTDIATLTAIKAQFGPLTNPNTIHHYKLSSMEKVALLVTQKVGTMGFFFIIFSWTILWLSWNLLAPDSFKFDPYPAFVLWLFISNIIQIHLLPLIMIGQNVLNKHSEIRAEHDYQTNVKAEKEIETILLHLENQQKTMTEILKRLDNLKS